MLQSEWPKCFDNWFERMPKCIELHGKYFEKQKSDFDDWYSFLFTNPEMWKTTFVCSDTCNLIPFQIEMRSYSEIYLTLLETLALLTYIWQRITWSDYDDHVRIQTLHSHKGYTAEIPSVIRFSARTRDETLIPYSLWLFGYKASTNFERCF